MRPALLSFDVFGTLLDWRSGLAAAVAAAGASLDGPGFERVIDAQAADEQAAFRPYREVVARSLEAVLGLSPAAAAAIGDGCGGWPPFADAPSALARLAGVAPLAALTNSDAAHGREARRALGAPFALWLCAGESRLYKPDPGVWRLAARRLGVEPGIGWWHVSAYADYDLEVARGLGLTTVLVRRPHHRPGPADLAVDDLGALAAHLGA